MTLFDIFPINSNNLHFIKNFPTVLNNMQHFLSFFKDFPYKISQKMKFKLTLALASKVAVLFKAVCFNSGTKASVTGSLPCN